MIKHLKSIYKITKNALFVATAISLIYIGGTLFWRHLYGLKHPETSQYILTDKVKNRIYTYCTNIIGANTPHGVQAPNSYTPKMIIESLSNYRAILITKEIRLIDMFKKPHESVTVCIVSIKNNKITYDNIISQTTCRGS